MKQYRVYYWGGQVSSTMSLAECRAHIAACIRAKLDDYADRYFIQRYDGDGEWVRVRT